LAGATAVALLGVGEQAPTPIEREGSWLAGAEAGHAKDTVPAEAAALVNANDPDRGWGGRAQWGLDDWAGIGTLVAEGAAAHREVQIGHAGHGMFEGVAPDDALGAGVEAGTGAIATALTQAGEPGRWGAQGPLRAFYAGATFPGQESSAQKGPPAAVYGLTHRVAAST